MAGKVPEDRKKNWSGSLKMVLTFHETSLSSKKVGIKQKRKKFDSVCLMLN